MSGREIRTFKTYELPDNAGAPLYTYGCKVKGKSKGAIPKIKKAVNFAVAAFYLSYLAFIIFWFLYSFIAEAVSYGVVRAFINFGGELIAVLAIGAVCLMICSNAISKLFRRITAGRNTAADSGESYEQPSEDAAPKVSDGLEIYAKNFVVWRNSERTVIDRGKTARINAEKTGKNYCFTFFSLWGEYVTVSLPKTEIKKLKRILGSELTVNEKPYLPPAVKASRRIDFSSVSVEGIVASVVCLGVGGGVIAMHYCVSESIPVVLGALFMFGGVIFACTLFGETAAISRIVIPLLFGAGLSVFPIFICKIVADGNGMPLKWSSLHEFLSSFSGLYAGVSFLVATGVLLLGYSVYSIIKFIKERL